jgi:hypothetical protein
VRDGIYAKRRRLWSPNGSAVRFHSLEYLGLPDAHGGTVSESMHSQGGGPKGFRTPYPCLDRYHPPNLLVPFEGLHDVLL